MVASGDTIQENWPPAPRPPCRSSSASLMSALGHEETKRADAMEALLSSLSGSSMRVGVPPFLWRGYPPVGLQGASRLTLTVTFSLRVRRRCSELVVRQLYCLPGGLAVAAVLDT